MVFPKTISDALLSSARWNARQAFQHWDSDDHSEALHASACIGIAAELLLKHLLATESPALLADLMPKTKEKAFRARRSFATDAYHSGLSEIHSCTADDAHFIHKETEDIPEVIDKVDFDLLMKIRNAACHLAALSPFEVRRDGIHFLIGMFEKSNPSDPNGSLTFQGLESKIERFESIYRQDRYELIITKVKGVKTRAASLAGTHDADQLAVEAREFLWTESESLFGSPEDKWDSFTSPAYRACKCMSCGNKSAELLCELEGEMFDVPAQGAGDQEVFEYGNVLHPHAFACGNCGLTFSSRELRVLAEKENGWALEVTKSIPEPSGYYSNGQGPRDIEEQKAWELKQTQNGLLESMSPDVAAPLQSKAIEDA